MAITSSNNLRRGSKGEDVLALQRQLNTLGYGLAEDGSYGAATESAVRDYQSKNNLSVDGVVGTHTWGSLTSASNPAATQTPAATQPAEPTALQQVEAAKPADYQKSDAVKAAEQALAQFEQNRPGAYTSSYSDQIQALLDQVLNREPFSYDFNADPLYQQYKDQYMQGGRQAMLDTTAQAAALSGGFGNSYGATAGNLAYQQYLTGLNEQLPALYNAALNRYQMEGQGLRDNLGLLQQAEDTEYGRYRDSLSDYYTDLNYLLNKANNLSQEEYNRYLDALSRWQADREYEYNKDWNAQQLAYQREQDAQAQANWEREFALANSGGSGGGSGGSSGGRSSSGSSGSSKKSSSNNANVTSAIDKILASASVINVGNAVGQFGADLLINEEESGRMSPEDAWSGIQSIANKLKWKIK